MTNRARSPSRWTDVRPRTRALQAGDWDDVLRIYAEGLATGTATFETEVPPREVLDARWHQSQRWVALVEGRLAGFAVAMPVSTRACYAGVAETSVYVGVGVRGQGVGRTLITRQNAEADACGLWTLQSSIFVVNAPSIALHVSCGYRVIGTRERIAQRNGVWHDTVLLERRRAVSPVGEISGGRAGPTVLGVATAIASFAVLALAGGALARRRTDERLTR